MNTLNPMAAEMLETSANGYAAAACAAFERHRAGTDADGSHAALPAEVWRRVGADAYAASLREAVATGVALLESVANGH